MASYQVIKALRDVLVKLYFDVKMATLIATEAGLNTQLIDFGGPPIQFWQSILTVANNNEQIQDVIDAARSHNPNNQALREAEQLFQSGAVPPAAGAATPPASTKPSGNSGGVNIGSVSGGIHNSIISGGDVNNARIEGTTPRDGEE
jgi:hypothetical protein